MGVERDTYKYQLIKGRPRWFGLVKNVIYSGLTYDISRRGAEHRKDFPGATAIWMKQVGRKVTRQEGLKWKKRQKPNRIHTVRNATTI